MEILVMRNKRLILALTGAVICGLLGVMLVTRYIASLQSHARDLGNVVVATAEIQVGAKIAPEQLALAPIPNGSAPEGAYRELAEVAGRIALVPIGIREPVTNSKLAPEGEVAGLGVLIPEGYRAMTVKVDDVVGVSGFVQPGSIVDIVAVIVPPAQAQASQGPISKIVLQNIKVLASGPRIDSPQNHREPSHVSAVTVLVTPEQAEKLVLATNEGRLQLVMRNYSDQEDAQTAGANKTSLLEGGSASSPPSPGAKTAEAKPVSQPRVRRTNYVAQRIEKPAQPTSPPVSRNSIELIEGSKRRDVDIP
jgi:pilus assembly protein CpaB